MDMVPLLTSVPAIFKVPATEVVTVAPVLIVRLLQLALLMTEGILVAVEVITTSVADVGTEPVHQLPAFDQSVLMFPVHWPVLVVAVTMV